MIFVKPIKFVMMSLLTFMMPFAVVTPVFAQAEKSSAVTTVIKAESPVNVELAPVKVIYVQENQPIQIIDDSGRLIKIVYLRKSK